MNTETVKAIQDAFAPVAAKIGAGAQYGWAVVLKQQYVEAVGDFIGCVFALAVVAAGIWFAKYALKKMKDGEGYRYDFPVAPLLSFFLISVGLLWFRVSLFDGVAHLINPDYYALQFFINLVHPTSN